MSFRKDIDEIKKEIESINTQLEEVELKSLNNLQKDDGIIEKRQYLCERVI